MKAISVKQPFATLILSGYKSIETRTWSTAYRGPLLICASKQPHAGSWLCENRELSARQSVMSYPITFPLGAMLCIVDLVDCRPMQQSDELKACCRIYPGAWAWELENVRPVFTKHVKGRLSFYDVPDSEIVLRPNGPPVDLLPFIFH